MEPQTKKRHKPDKDAITERHIRIPLALLNSHAYIALSANAKRLMLDLYSTLNSYNNGDISATLGVLKHRDWRSPTTLSNCLKELVAVGILQVTRYTSGVQNGVRMCKLYRFTDRITYENPKKEIESAHATKDYLKFKSLSEANVAIKKALSVKQKK